MQGFIVEAGPLRGEVFEFHEAEIVIGRDSTCAIRIDSSDVSREHATVRMGGGGPILVDLRSRNGTFVNEERITQKPLKPGDVVRVGRTVMRYKDRIMPEDRVLPTDVVEVYEPGRRREEASPDAGPTSADAETSPLARFSLLFALGSIHWAFAALTVAFGIAAIVRIKQRGDQKGIGLAVLALFIGGTASAYHLNVKVLHPYFEQIRAANAKIECRNNLRAIGEAISRYVGASGGEYPKSLEDLYPLYIDNRRRFVCPGDPNPLPGKKGLMLSYVYTGSKRGDRGAQNIVAFDRRPTHHGRKGRFVLYSDGQVVWMSEQELEEKVPEELLFPTDRTSKHVSGR